MPKKVQRIFYIDVRGLSPSDIPNYMEAIKNSLRSTETAEDIHFFIPVNDHKESTKGLFPQLMDFLFGNGADYRGGTHIETMILETDD